MKKIPILLFFIIFAIRPTFACDLCGCSAGNYFIGPFPQFNKHFVGIQYSFQHFNTVLNTDNSQFSKDFYQTTELLAGTKIKNKWQILAYVPYNIYHTQSDDGVKQNKGLGDMTFIGNFNLFERKYLNRDTQTVYQNLWIGAGIKVPTGKFSVDSTDLVSSANMQAGTGSVDFLLTSMYSYQVKSWGLNISLNYKLNQKADNFKFGNRLAATAFLFRNFHITKITISPNTGLLYDNTAENSKFSEKIADTGGNVLLAALGSELRYKNLVLGLNAEIPVFSDLSAGQTDARLRGMCHLSFMF